MATDPKIPDLQSILASLAQFANPPVNRNVANTSGTGVSAIQAADHFDAIQSSDGRGLSPLPPPNLRMAQDPRPKPQTRTATASPKPMIDPATITVWQEALRCVTKIAAQNVQFAACIRKMMADQQTNEMRWYAERQALKQKQAARSSSSAKAQSILRSLNGGMAAEETSVDHQADAATELITFDLKIYAAQEAMEQAMTAELKGLGVPFFGTDPSLVVPDDYDMAKEQLPESQPKWSKVVTESEMLALRRRMVGHLEDLYKD